MRRTCKRLTAALVWGVVVPVLKPPAFAVLIVTGRDPLRPVDPLLDRIRTWRKETPDGQA